MAESALFADVRYYLSPTLSKQTLQEFANILDVNEAEHVDRPQDATHVISNTDRFDGWESVPQSTVMVTVCPILFLLMKNSHRYVSRYGWSAVLFWEGFSRESSQQTSSGQCYKLHPGPSTILRIQR